MGQVFLCANLDKQEYLPASKMMNDCWIGNDLPGTAGFLLYRSWYGDRVLWVGQYIEPGRLLPEEVAEKDKELNLYAFVEKTFKKRREMTDCKVYRYLINHGKMEFVDIEKVRESNGWRVHPLPLLTSTTRGSGGNYVAKDDERDGKYECSWAGDPIACDDEHPGAAFTEIIPDFFEDWS